MACYPRPATNTPTPRQSKTLRPLSAELSSLSHADGSASLHVGNTYIMAAIHGPMSPRMYKFEKYDKGVVSVAFSRGLMVHSGSTGGGSTDNIDMDTTNNSTNQNNNQNQTSTTMKTVPIPPPPGLGSTERELEYIVRDTLSSCILLDRYPRCVIQVVLQIVQADGCVLGSAINCALLALMDCGIAMWGLPVASTCVVIPRSCYTRGSSSDSEEKGEENTIWLDPTAEEEGGVGHSIVVLVTDGRAKQQQIKEEGESDDEDIIASMTFGAPLSLKGLLSSMKCMKQSSSTAMLAFMRLAVEQKVQREVETLWS